MGGNMAGCHFPRGHTDIPQEILKSHRKYKQNKAPDGPDSDFSKTSRPRLIET